MILLGMKMNVMVLIVTKSTCIVVTVTFDCEEGQFAPR